MLVLPCTSDNQWLQAYKTDTWFSTNAWSKPLSLLWATLAVVILGGLGIYVVSGTSLYNACWQVGHVIWVATR